MTDDLLNVLVLESEPGAANDLREELATRGHHVVGCHEQGASAFPCNALVAEHGCPFDDRGIVDVVVDVRRRPRSQPSPLEDGVRCALQHHVPLVVAGSPILNPYVEYGAEVVEARDDVVAACERVAAAPLPRHTALAAQALATTLERHPCEDPQPTVTVRRRSGSLLVEVHGGDRLDHATKGVAAVRIIAALRSLDRHAAGIDVVCSTD